MQQMHTVKWMMMVVNYN
jgi:hypothetical protein